MQASTELSCCSVSGFYYYHHLSFHPRGLTPPYLSDECQHGAWVLSLTAVIRHIHMCWPWTKIPQDDWQVVRCCHVGVVDVAIFLHLVDIGQVSFCTVSAEGTFVWLRWQHLWFFILGAVYLLRPIHTDLLFSSFCPLAVNQRAVDWRFWSVPPAWNQRKVGISVKRHCRVLQSKVTHATATDWTNLYPRHKTSNSAIAERPRCRVGAGRQRTLFILGLLESS